MTCTADRYHTRYSIGSGDMWYMVRGSIQKSNNRSSERLEVLLFLGSEITKSADFWPRLFLNQETTMISGPIVDGFNFWRRRCLLKRELIAPNISHNSWSKKGNPVDIFFFCRQRLLCQPTFHLLSTAAQEWACTGAARQDDLVRSYISHELPKQRIPQKASLAKPPSTTF